MQKPPVKPTVIEPLVRYVDPATDRMPIAALVLGVAGLIPFAGLAMLIYLNPEPDLKFLMGLSLVGYGATIASFLGGVRWGLALGSKNRLQQSVHFFVAIVPPFLSWLVITARLDTAIAALAVLFALLGFVDTWTLDMLNAPRWYRKLRTALTISVVCILVAVMFVL